MSQQIIDLLKARKAELIEKFLADVAELDAGIASFGGGGLQFTHTITTPLEDVPPAQVAEEIRRQHERFTPEERALKPGESMHVATFAQGFPAQPPAPETTVAPPAPVESIAQQPGETVDEGSGEIKPAEPWDVEAAPPAAKPGGRRTHEQIAADNDITLDIVKQFAGEQKITKGLIEQAAAAYKAYLDETSAAPAPQAPAPEPVQAPQPVVQQPAAPTPPAQPDFGPNAPATAPQPVSATPSFGPPATVQQPVQPQASTPQFQQPVAVQPSAPAASMPPGFGSANGLPY